MNGKVPPHNTDAEVSVLGAAMLSKDALFDIMEKVRAEDFYDAKHGEIFTAITELYNRNEPVDIITVSEELKKRQVLEMVGGRVYVASLSSSVPSAANAGEYAKIVAEKAVLRNLIDTSAKIVERGYKADVRASEVLEYAEAGIFEIGQKGQRKDFVSLRDVLVKNIENIDKMSKQEGNLIGITTGFADLDTLTSGLQKSDMIVLAARPSMGKTAFALNMAQMAAKKSGAKVLIFSLEMSAVQLGQRMLATESRIDMQKIKTGSLERRDWSQVNMALDVLSEADIQIDDMSRTIMEFRNKCRRMKTSKGLDLVVVDYLQMMNFEGKSEGRQQEITTLSRYLKQLAKEMDCPVVVLSQLSRAPEMRNDHRPMLSDLRESGAIEQDADIVMFLYRDDYYNKDDPENAGKCEVIVAKNRSGPTGTVEVAWLGKYTKFADLSNIEQQ